MEPAAWPVAASLVADHRTSRGTLRSDGSSMYWVENRPREGGRQVVMRLLPGGQPHEIDLRGRSARSRVHEYGGGAFCVLPAQVNERATPAAGQRRIRTSNPRVAFVDQADQRVLLADVPDVGARGEAVPHEGTPDGTEPLALSREAPSGERWHHGDLWPAPDGRGVLATRERHREGVRRPRRELVYLPAPSPTDPLGPAPHPARVLFDGTDFVASARGGPPEGPGWRLAWITWNHPDMPWDASTLWVGVVEIEAGGGVRLEGVQQVAGGGEESVGSPAWCDDGGLVFVSDRGGWWQPWRWHPREGARRLSGREAEFHTPDWQLGQMSLAPAGPGEVACRWREPEGDRLGLLDVSSGDLRPIEQPCVVVGGLCAVPGGVAWLGSTPWSTTQPWRCELGAAAEPEGEPSRAPRIAGNPRPAGSGEAEDPEPLDRARISRGRPIVVPGPGGHVPALWYPPRPGGSPLWPDGPAPVPPLIVHCHGGPTGGSDPGLDLVVQYFTSRGFAYVQVDYRGSAGHGRRFRRALDGLWGVADVEDCTAVARWLADRGEVDGERMAIRGSSAGGFTALGALVGQRVFAAATSWYGVTDLLSLVASTHDFEAHYTDRLVGPLPEAEPTFRARSPLEHAGEIQGAVLVLQGLEDPVVPPEQAASLVATMLEQGRRCEYLTFPGEGHGFRRAENIATGLDAELDFYRRILRLGGPSSHAVPGKLALPGNSGG